MKERTKEGIVDISKPSLLSGDFLSFLYHNKLLFDGIKNRERIIVKINLPYWETPPGSLTRRESLLDLLRFLVSYQKPITVVESRYNWVPTKVKKEYGIWKHEIKDLFEVPHYGVRGYSINGRKLNLYISKIVFDPMNFIVTIGPPKTHEYVIYTGAVKTKMGFLRKKKRHVHGFSDIRYYKDDSVWEKMVECIHRNLIVLNGHINVDVSILDGLSCMEGNGPVFGRRVEWDMWGISNDAALLDCVVASLMDLRPVWIAYLSNYFMALVDRNIGQFIQNLKERGYSRKFDRPPNYEREQKISDRVIERWGFLSRSEK